MVKEEKHLKKGDPEPTFPNDSKLQLLSMRFCPYAQRIHLVLEAKKLPYHTFNINLTEKPEWLTKYSPLGKVPALGLPTEDGKPFIHESLIIADYLDEKYPEKRLYPTEPIAKAIDRLLIQRFENIITGYYKAIGFINGQGGLTEIATGLDEFEAELRKRGSTFFGGDEPGMLDLMIWPWCERIAMLKYVVGDRYEMDKVRYAKLVEWNASMIGDPAVSIHYLGGEVHIKYFESRKAGNTDYDMLLKSSL